MMVSYAIRKEVSGLCGDEDGQREGWVLSQGGNFE